MMKNISLIVVLGVCGLLLLPTNLLAQQNCVVDQESLIRHVYTLASDSMAGRMTGEEGQRMAANYIADEFRETGLLPFASDSSYFQPFTLYTTVDNKMEFTGLRRVVGTFAVARNYTNVSDSIIMVYNDPRSPVPNSVIDDKKAFLVINPKNLKQAAKIVRKRHREGLRQFIVIADGPSWEYQLLMNEMPGRAFRLNRITSPSKLDRIIKGLDSTVAAVIRPNEVSQIIGYRPDFGMLEEEVRKNRALIRIGNLTAMNYLPGRVDSVITENVAGILPGKHGNDEVVVITAHYDHVGVDSKGVNVGADDNASGTAALIEIARVLKCFQESGAGFNRSVLFVAFSAEEVGLLGSKFFVGSEEFAGIKPLLNINMDMIGRSVKYGFIETFRLQATGYIEDTTRRESYVYLMNKGKSTRKYVRYARLAAIDYPGFIIDRSPGMLERITFRHGSDHANFIKKRIPVLVWFTGLHPDYHTPRDTPDKIDYENITKVTGVILKTTEAIIRR